MEEALAKSETSFATGQIVKGTIIEIRSKEVMVDIGYKSEGAIPLSISNIVVCHLECWYTEGLIPPRRNVNEARIIWPGTTNDMSLSSAKTDNSFKLRNQSIFNPLPIFKR